jgi:hypothetical protein
VRDGITIARTGRPAVALVTTEFWEQGHAVARSVGMPDVPRVLLPHPVAGAGAARMAEIAAGIADEIMAHLTGVT